MKKLLSLLMLGLVSCSSCSKKNDVVQPKPIPTVVVDPPPTPVAPPQHATGDTWTFTVPANWKKLEGIGASEAEVSYIESTAHQLISLSKENFNGTYEEYVLSGIRALKANGIDVQSATQVNLNGNTFVIIECTKEDTSALMWVTVVNGIGYNFSCGGKMSDTTIRETCSKIASSLEIQK